MFNVSLQLNDEECFPQRGWSCFITQHCLDELPTWQRRLTKQGNPSITRNTNPIRHCPTPLPPTTAPRHLSPAHLPPPPPLSFPLPLSLSLFLSDPLPPYPFLSPRCSPYICSAALRVILFSVSYIVRLCASPAYTKPCGLSLGSSSR